MSPASEVINIQTAPRTSAINSLVHTLSSRFSNLFGGKKARNFRKIYGYLDRINFQDNYDLWDRGGMAHRVVSAPARSTWRDRLSFVKKDKDKDEKLVEVLVEELQTLNKHGKFIKTMEQADVLNRLGRFSILFVGVPDGLELREPVGTASPNRLNEVYFRAYAEDGIDVVEWNTDIFSPRNGLPELYSLVVQDRGDKKLTTTTTTRVVHWSRVVHLAEGALDSPIEGKSALQPVFDALTDILKTTGASAEAFFRNARNRFSLETNPDFAASLDDDEKVKLEASATEFQDEWKDFIATGGMQVKSLNVPNVSPADTYMVLAKVVASATGFNLRWLLGEGAGQYAGNEDKEAYNQIIQDRRELDGADWVETALRVLATAGMLELRDDYVLMWDTPEMISAKDKSDTAAKNANALSATGLALSSDAFDGVLSVESALRLVYGDQATAELDIDEGSDHEDDEDENTDHGDET